MLGIFLTFVAAILTVAARFSISPSQTGVALSYILSTQPSFGWLVRQIAELENDMNSVERVIHYVRNLEQEPPHEIPERKPMAPWPAEGHVEIKDVVLKYRPELPDVLRGLTMDVAPGEKVGIVGRTGAGKSSIMTALYRLVELSTGTIKIDGVDISTIGLKDLRSALAIIPQDPVRSPSITLPFLSINLSTNLLAFVVVILRHVAVELGYFRSIRRREALGCPQAIVSRGKHETSGWDGRGRAGICCFREIHPGYRD